jgi:ABC-2 type transport system permease protein
MNSIGLQTFIAKEIQRFLRVFNQTLLSPWINALLYIFIFGFVVGERIELIGGVSYIEFVMPGIIMLNLISASFSQTSSSLYFQRFAKHIEEVLVAPFSYLEIVVGFLVGGVVRGFVVGGGVYVLAILFGGAEIVNIWLFIGYSLAVAIIFSLIGLIIGLWSESFEQLTVLNTFVITPLTFLGGVFNSVSMLPEWMQTVVRFNPFFYFVDGLRYSMTGISEANFAVGGALIGGLIVVLGGVTWYLFKIGWKIRV